MISPTLIDQRATDSRIIHYQFTYQKMIVWRKFSINFAKQRAIDWSSIPIVFIDHGIISWRMVTIHFIDLRKISNNLFHRSKSDRLNNDLYTFSRPKEK